MNNKRIKGIYGYFDTLKYEIIYIGKDSHIEKKKRHREHYQPSLKNVQKINQVLQNDKVGRYSYVEFEKGYYDNNILNEKEIYWISYFEPKHNYTEGGDGLSGEDHPFYGKHRPKEICKKISDSMRGIHIGEKNPMYGKQISEEHRKKLREAMLGENNPMYDVHRYGKDNPNFSDYIKIRKVKCKNCKQGYIWAAKPSNHEGRKMIGRVDLNKCIEMVEDFINSPENTLGYTDYKIIGDD